MNEKFVKYLEAIDIPPLIITDRIEKIFKWYENTCPDEITDIVVSEYLTDEGTRVYENLWFFSKFYCMEAKEFLRKEDFDMTYLMKQVYYWNIKNNKYELETATNESQVYLEFVYAYADLKGIIKASKKNCDYLFKILKTYIIPNLTK